MTLTLQSTQFIAIAMIIFGFLGFLRGGSRSVIVMAFTFAALLFLYIGGAVGISSFIFIRLPETLHTLTGGALFSSSMPPPSAQQVLISEIVILVLAIVLGNIIGGRVFGPAGSVLGRFVGALIGLFTGYAVIYYIGHIFVGNPSVSVGVTAPNPNTLSNYILIIFIIALVGVLIGWLTNTFGN